MGQAPLLHPGSPFTFGARPGPLSGEAAALFGSYSSVHAHARTQPHLYNISSS